MNTRTAARAALPSAEDDFYAQDGETHPRRQVGAEGNDDAPDDAALNNGQGENEGENEGEDEEVLGADGRRQPADGDDDDDFFAPRPPSRGEHRHQTLANENRQLRRELDELRGVSRQPVAPAAPALPAGETDEQFEARIQLLSMEDKMDARYKRDRQIQNAQLAQARVENAIAQDRAAFQAKAIKDSRYRRWEERVEAEFNRRRQQGQLVSREDILKWMLGDRMVNGDDAPVRGERRRAKERVDRERTRPPSNTGSDVRANRRPRESEREARARRLEGQQI